MADWPTPAEIAAAMDRPASEEAKTSEEPEPKLADETLEAQTQPETPAEPKTEPKPDVAAIAETVKEKGPKAPEVKELLSSLDEATLEQLGQALLPKLQSKLSTRSKDLREARALVEELRRADSAAEQRHIEMMTVGLSEEDKQKYVAEKTRKRSEESTQAVQAKVQENNKILGGLWSIVSDAGLPVDMDVRTGLPREDADPDVKRLWEAVWDDPDPSVAFRHFMSEAPKVAAARKAARTQPQAQAESKEEPKPKSYSKDEVEEILQRGVKEALVKAGVLNADTGKSGSGGGGSRIIKNDKERIAEVTRRLSAL